MAKIRPLRFGDQHWLSLPPIEVATSSIPISVALAAGMLLHFLNIPRMIICYGNRLHIHVQSCNSYSGDAQQSSSQLSEAKVGDLTSHTISIFLSGASTRQTLSASNSKR